MTTDNQIQVPASTLSPDSWLTTGTLILIGIAIVVVLIAIWWGARLKRERVAARRDIAGRREDSPAASVEPRAGTGATAGERRTTEPPTAPAPTPPVAPPPPPLASGDVPIPAAAPLDASPATIAADAQDATPPAPPAEPAPAPTPPAEPAPTPAPVSGGADDLTLLKGVGPKLAARLGELGITSFAQIAALDAEAAAALDAQLGTFQGRMARDRWIDQAKSLSRDDRAGFEAEFGKL